MSRKSDMPWDIGWRWSEDLQMSVPIFSNAEKTRLMQRYARRRDVLEHRARRGGRTWTQELRDRARYRYVLGHA